MTCNITLSWQEAHLAAQQGVVRRLGHAYKGTKHYLNPPDGSPRWQYDITGCLGEMAVCKYFGLYWTGAEKIRAIDAGLFEVRTTHYKTGELYLTNEDDENLIFILVIENTPNLTLAGWITAKEGRAIGTIKEKQRGRPMCWVSQEQLYPMSELKKNERQAA